MRQIQAEEISTLVARLCIEANLYMEPDLRAAMERAVQTEESPVGRECLRSLLQNVDIAAEQQIPICQDTGMAIIFVEYGQEVALVGGSFEDAINEGVRRGYRDGYLRKSVVDDPLLARVNTGDNTPAVIHTRIVPGEKIKIIVAPKGFGSENMSRVQMMIPADGWPGVKRFVVEAVRQAGANPCPPVVIGVGIGGTMEKVALLAREALLREIGSVHPDPRFAVLEAELLEAVNNTGVGPEGLGGRMTALAAHINTFPTHIAGMPVAVNICCHVARHKTGTI